MFTVDDLEDLIRTLKRNGKDVSLLSVVLENARNNGADDVSKILAAIAEECDPTTGDCLLSDTPAAEVLRVVAAQFARRGPAALFDDTGYRGLGLDGTRRKTADEIVDAFFRKPEMTEWRAKNESHPEVPHERMPV